MSNSMRNAKLDKSNSICSFCKSSLNNLGAAAAFKAAASHGAQACTREGCTTSSSRHFPCCCTQPAEDRRLFGEQDKPIAEGLPGRATAASGSSKSRGFNGTYVHLMAGSTMVIQQISCMDNCDKIFFSAAVCKVV